MLWNQITDISTSTPADRSQPPLGLHPYRPPKSGPMPCTPTAHFKPTTAPWPAIILSSAPVSRSQPQLLPALQISPFRLGTAPLQYCSRPTTRAVGGKRVGCFGVEAAPTLPHETTHCLLYTRLARSPSAGCADVNGPRLLLALSSYYLAVSSYYLVVSLFPLGIGTNHIFRPCPIGSARRHQLHVEYSSSELIAPQPSALLQGEEK